MRTDKITKPESYEMFTALSGIYISIHLFDLKNNIIKTFKSNQFIDKLAAVSEIGQEKVNNVMGNIPKDEHVKMMLEFVDFSTLQERMGNEDDIAVVFEGKINGWCRARFIVLEREGDVINRCLFTVECINEEKNREKYLLYLAGTDMMTGIYNRGYGEEQISAVLNNDKPGAFCLFDIDGFKQINDKYGHGVGDKALVAIADCLKTVSREGDIVMRLGGDEFAAFFADVTKESMTDIIDSLFKEIDKISIEPMEEQVKVSLGAVIAKPGMNFDSVYKLADVGVYKCKNDTTASDSSYVIV